VNAVEVLMTVYTVINRLVHVSGVYQQPHHCPQVTKQCHTIL